MDKIKTFTVRIPYSIWVVCRKAAIDREMSMNDLTKECLENYAKRREGKLKKTDTMV